MAQASRILVSRTLSASDISGPIRKGMWALFSAYYTEVSRERFDEDLRPKTHVILLEDSGDGSLQGFSTLQAFRRRVAGRSVAVLYSGDTIIHQAYWGQTALQRAWLTQAMRLKARHLHLPVYWFLITKGYKTYLLLSRNFPEYWPRWDRATPPWQGALTGSLANEMFGAEYDPARGVVCHTQSLGRLREGVAPIGPELMAQPDIRFFAEKNPDHLSGDELCCLGRIDLALCRSYLTKLGRRGLQRTLGRVKPSWHTLS